MRRKYHVQLTTEERQKLNEILSKGKMSARLVKRANILLAVDEKNEKQIKLSDIANQYHTCVQTVIQVEKEYVGLGFDAAMTYKRNPKPPVTPIVTGDIEARIIQLACSETPDGRSQWSLKLLSQKAVELKIVDHICPETIRKTLKKRNKAASE